MIVTRFLLAIVLLLPAGAAASLADSPPDEGQPRRIELDRCVWKCTKGGRYRSVLVTPTHFIVSIDANRCPDQIYYCPTSYNSFSTDNDTPVEVKGYVPGEKTTEVFNAFVPRGNRYLYVNGINRSQRSDVLDLAALIEGETASGATLPGPSPTKPEPAPATSGAQAPPGSDDRLIDELYAAFSNAYAEYDADMVAGLYSENAFYLSPGGDVVRGRAAIREGFDRLFRDAERRGNHLDIRFETVERRIEGALAWEVGYYTLTRIGGERPGTSRGKFTVVLEKHPADGWRLRVDAFSDAPPAN